MKKITLIASLLLLNVVYLKAQFLKLGAAAAEAEQRKMTLRGPVQPIDASYGNYKTFSLKLNITPTFESSVQSKKIPYSLNDLSQPLNIFGLKKVDNGDFKIVYDLKRYELVEDDYVEKDYQTRIRLYQF